MRMNDNVNKCENCQNKLFISCFDQKSNDIWKIDRIPYFCMLFLVLARLSIYLLHSFNQKTMYFHSIDSIAIVEFDFIELNICSAQNKSSQQFWWRDNNFFDWCCIAAWHNSLIRDCFEVHWIRMVLTPRVINWIYLMSFNVFYHNENFCLLLLYTKTT